MLANWEAMLAGIPGSCAEICRSVHDGDMTWTEWRWPGTRSDRQAFEMRGGTLLEDLSGSTTAARAPGRLWCPSGSPPRTGWR